MVPAGKWHNVTNTGNKPLETRTHSMPRLIIRLELFIKQKQTQWLLKKTMTNRPCLSG